MLHSSSLCAHVTIKLVFTESWFNKKCINSQKINKDDIVSHKSKASKYEVNRFGHRTPNVLSMMHNENAGVLADGNEDKEVAHQDVVLQLKKPEI